LRNAVRKMRRILPEPSIDILLEEARQRLSPDYAYDRSDQAGDVVLRGFGGGFPAQLAESRAGDWADRDGSYAGQWRPDAGGARDLGEVGGAGGTCEGGGVDARCEGGT